MVVSAADHADRIFVNGKIWTGLAGVRPVQAMAISGERILAVGTNAEIRALASADTAIADLKGRLVVPGFNDAHWHFSPGGRADLMDVSNIDEILQRMKSHAATRPESGWLTGRGWGYAAFPDQRPHRKYLDGAFPDRPVFIWERDGHMDSRTPPPSRSPRWIAALPTLRPGALNATTPASPRAS